MIRNLSDESHEENQSRPDRSVCHDLAVSDRVLKARHCYMEEEEMTLTEMSPLGVIQASTRVWSIKEGVAKATDRPLAESWKRVKVNNIGWDRSRLTVEGTRYMALHDTAGDHIFTLVKRES